MFMLLWLLLLLCLLLCYVMLCSYFGFVADTACSVPCFSLSKHQNSPNSQTSINNKRRAATHISAEIQKDYKAGVWQEGGYQISAEGGFKIYTPTAPSGGSWATLSARTQAGVGGMGAVSSLSLSLGRILSLSLSISLSDCTPIILSLLFFWGGGGNSPVFPCDSSPGLQGFGKETLLFLWGGFPRFCFFCLSRFPSFSKGERFGRVNHCYFLFGWGFPYVCFLFFVCLCVFSFLFRGTEKFGTEEKSLLLWAKEGRDQIRVAFSLFSMTAKCGVWKPGFSCIVSQIATPASPSHPKTPPSCPPKLAQHYALQNIPIHGGGSLGGGIGFFGG